MQASTLTAAAKIQPIEFQNLQAEPIRSLAILPVDGRPHPVSGSMFVPPWCKAGVILKIILNSDNLKNDFAT